MGQLGLHWRSLLLVMMALAAAGCRVEQEPAVDAGEGAVAVVVTAPATPSLCQTVVRRGQHRGVSLVATGGPDGVYPGNGAGASLDALLALGGDAISLTPYARVAGLDAPQVSESSWDRPDFRADTAEIVQHARQLGFRVSIKPHLWVEGAWRGEIEPRGGWPEWFASYGRYILYWADFAETHDVEELVIGVELKSSSLAQEGLWRTLIAQVRGVYSGELTYAANWDEVEQVPFWDALDAIGVQMFAPLSDNPDATYAELQSGAAEWLDRYRAVAERVGRPIVLTEVGFKSVYDTARRPWQWPQELESDAVISQEAQAQAYCAILQTFGRDDAVHAMYWWKWFADLGATEEGATGFWPRGKLAEDVLRNAWAL